jgi:hypothetical protein
MAMLSPKHVGEMETVLLLYYVYCVCVCWFCKYNTAVLYYPIRMTNVIRTRICIYDIKNKSGG